VAHLAVQLRAGELQASGAYLRPLRLCFRFRTIFIRFSSQDSPRRPFDAVRTSFPTQLKRPNWDSMGSYCFCDKKLLVSQPMKKTPSPEPALRSDKNFWTVKDAARYLGMSQNTVYDWLKPNRKAPRPSIVSTMPPVYRFGKRKGIRFQIKEFTMWVETLKRPAGER
jgi:predicted DNA-binding transcriptional regulator AlpA